MRLGGDQVGKWGVALLAVTGATGLLLAWHGWAGRQATIVPALAGRATPGTPGTPAASPTPATSTPVPSATSPARSSHLGPALSAEPFANVAFQIWPEPMSATARQALTGLSVSVRRQPSGLLVTAGVVGQPPAAPQLYPGGVKVYVVEASMGDDSGSADYNLGDDGLVVTNSQGRIIQ